MPQNTQGHELIVHNFTSLIIPSLRSDGIPIRVIQPETLLDIAPFSLVILNSVQIEQAEELSFLRQQTAVLLWDPEQKLTDWPSCADIALSPQPSEAELQKALIQGARIAKLKEQCLQLQNQCAIADTRNQQLGQIGMALMSERHIDTLLNLILDKAMSLTQSDAGCLYLLENRAGTVENPRAYWENKQVRFKLTRNNSVEFPFEETLIPIAHSSIIGYTLVEGVALNLEDVYHLDGKLPYKHNHIFDTNSGYYSRSMLCVPLIDNHNHVIGALQLINKCRRKNHAITSSAAADAQVMAYQTDDVNLCMSLASQASVAILNAQYEHEIKNLFEGFIKASVTAIESRDPTTSGHSQRVADYCIDFALCLSRLSNAKFKHCYFSDSQLQELRYAALLHDFGKIGIREQVLTKAKKLYPEALEQIGQRIACIKRCIAWGCALDKVRLYQGKTTQYAESIFSTWDKIQRDKIEEMEDMWACILKANEPSPLANEIAEKLQRWAETPYTDPEGYTIPILLKAELEQLLIPQGTLSHEERDSIQSHVMHTYNFLSKIPWTKDLKHIPEIAFAHHEKLNGTGYPRGLIEEQIPVPSQIMTVCDIYDALTARDRPYKRAIPTDKALAIIEMEVKSGKIDKELFRVFVESKIYLGSK